MEDEIKKTKHDDYLRDEYLLLQQQYEDFDRRSLTIKGWVIGGSIAALALSFNGSIVAALFVPVAVIVVCLVAWYLEAYWKTFQYSHSDRIRVIEAYFRNEQEIFIRNPEPFQIYNSWYESYAHDRPLYPYEKEGNRRYKRPRSLRVRWEQALRQHFVFIPYLPLIVLSVLTLIMAPAALPKSNFTNANVKVAHCIRP